MRWIKEFHWSQLVIVDSFMRAYSQILGIDGIETIERLNEEIRALKKKLKVYQDADPQFFDYNRHEWGK